MKTDNLGLFLALTGATAMGEEPGLGQIVVANSSQNYAASLAQDVAGYLAGQPATNQESLLDLLAPPVQVADFFQFAKSDDQAYLTEADDSDVRGLGASFKRVEHTGTIVTDATLQKGLTKRVDHRTIPRINGALVSGWENREAEALKQRLIRAELLRVGSVLDGAANADTKTWNAASNPDGDLRAQAERTRVKSGLPATHLVIGSAAQQLRQDVYEASTRANSGVTNHAGYTMEQLANYCAVGQAVVHNALYQTKKGAAKGAIQGLVVYSYSALPGTMIDDPSNLKRAWTPTMSGGMWMVFIQEGAAWTDITVFQQSKIFAPLTQGIEKITVSA
jgi:hypothetical protein